jgi:hypothetical protein
MLDTNLSLIQSDVTQIGTSLFLLTFLTNLHQIISLILSLLLGLQA